MAEKRSDYRKKQSKGLFSKIKSAFADNDESPEDTSPDLSKETAPSRRRPLAGDGQEYYQPEQPLNTDTNRQAKALRLKKRLNRAILIVFVLIILVLLALFHL